MYGLWCSLLHQPKTNYKQKKEEIYINISIYRHNICTYLILKTNQLYTCKLKIHKSNLNFVNNYISTYKWKKSAKYIFDYLHVCIDVIDH